MKNKRKAVIFVAWLAILFWAGDAVAFYNPSTGRWLSRDPLADIFFLEGLSGRVDPGRYLFLRSESLKPCYTFVQNQPVDGFDFLGLDRWFVIDGYHAYVLVDNWNRNGCKDGQRLIEFGPASKWYELLSLTGVTVPGYMGITDPAILGRKPGVISYTHYSGSTAAEDKNLIRAAYVMQALTPSYNVTGTGSPGDLNYPFIYNCITFALGLYNIR